MGSSTETVAFQVYEILKNNLKINFKKNTLLFHDDDDEFSLSFFN